MAVLSFVCATSTLGSVHAQNLLVNGDLDAPLPPGGVYYDGFTPSAAGDVPGWILSLGAADGSYILVSPESNPLAGVNDADFGIGPAGGSMSTAPLSRPSVVTGLSYLATVTTDNYFTATNTSYFVDWFDGGGSLISSSGGVLGDPNGALTYAPYTQLFSITATAPVGAATAGVRFASGNPQYAGLAADNFSFSQVPEPTTAALAAIIAVAAASGLRRRKH